MVRRDARPSVEHLHPKDPRLLVKVELGNQLDRGRRWRKARRVGEQVGDHLDQARRVDADENVGGVDLDGDPAGGGGGRHELDAVLDELRQVHVPAIEPPPIGLGRGHAQEAVGELAQADRVRMGGLDRCPQGRPVGRVEQRELELGSERRERRPEIVRGAHDERALAADGLLDPGQHPVEGPGERADLVVALDPGQPAVELAAPDRVGLAGETRDRSQGPASQPPAPEHREDDQGPAGEGHRLREGAEIPVDRRERAADDHCAAALGRRRVDGIAGAIPGLERREARAEATQRPARRRSWTGACLSSRGR